MDREQITINPFRSPSARLFFKAFTLRSIWPSVTFITAFSAVIYVIDLHVIQLRVASTILTVIGTVIGFVVSYRTSSAYERYNEGRKLWSSITINSRTLAKLIWIHCPCVLRVPDDQNPLTEEEKLKDLIEKKTTINLILAFAIAVKHYLRGEHGIYYEDLYHLVCFIPRYAIPSSNPQSRAGTSLAFQETVSKSTSLNFASKSTSINFASKSTSLSFASKSQPPNANSSVAIQVEEDENNDDTCLDPDQQNQTCSSPVAESSKASTSSGFPSRHPMEPSQEILPAYNPPKSAWYTSLPMFIIVRSILKGARKRIMRRPPRTVFQARIHDDNVPLEIICCLDGYISTLRHRKILDVPTANALISATMSFTDSVTSLDRILTTPIPFGYIVHLRLVIWGYLIFLPFQLLGAFGYLTIIVMFLVSTAFLGFLQVGEEIENPFGYDANDLDMDNFCHSVIAKDLDEITSMPPPDPKSYYFSNYNLPLFLAEDSRSAAKLLKSKVGAEEFLYQLGGLKHF